MNEDLGSTLEMTAVDSDAATQPDSFDIADIEYWICKKIWPTGNLQAMDTSKITNYDKIVGIFTVAKKAGQFRAFWKSFDDSVNLMASGEVVIQSMWSPAITDVKSRGIPCVYQPLKEGYRSCGGGIGLSAGLSGLPLDAAYESVGLGRRVPDASGVLLGRAGNLERGHVG